MLFTKLMFPIRGKLETGNRKPPVSGSLGTGSLLYLIELGVN
jgi:hypothetical protein